MQPLLVATRNAHKTREIRHMLGPGWEVRDLLSLPGAPEVDETGGSFEENAILKAVAVSRHLRGTALADDSGLVVDALNGEPGVRSARFAGPAASDAENRQLLRERLARLPGERFPARFCCVMALADDGELRGTFTGVVEGTVTPFERGDGGFGYDSMFRPAGYDATFAELPPEVKNGLSHRARALAKVLEFLRG